MSDYPLKNDPKIVAPSENTSSKPQPQKDKNKDSSKNKSKHPTNRKVIPIIMSLILVLLLSKTTLNAQMEVSISTGITYSDNVFHLSDYDINRWKQGHPNLDFVNTTDDLTLMLQADLAYPFRYQWWKFIPSVTAKVSQNISNPDKQRQDILMRFRVERYYWNFTALYGYYPYIYVCNYIDSDGTGESEKYSYERNLYRGDLNVKPFKNTTIQFHGRYEEYFYNQYWTEYDANATTLGLGARYSFPAFSMGASYNWRVLDNYNHDAEDASYESDIYKGDIRLKKTPLSASKPKGASFYPELAMSYEERFYQSDDPRYGGRVDRIYNTNAALNFLLNEQWNIKLDYTHTFRNIESPVEEIRLTKEYSENKFSLTAKYSF